MGWNENDDHSDINEENTEISEHEVKKFKN